MIASMARLFVSQTQMDKWTTEGKVRLHDDIMMLPAMSRSFKLSSAVHFTKMIDGDDKKKLLGKVKTLAQLTELGAEHYGASVIMGETGYECTEGFVGTPIEGSVAGSGLIKLGQQ
jgi:hypothetical protein